MTMVDSRITADPNFRNAAGALTDVSGRYTPNIPRLKATAVATYRHNEQWSGTLAARYSARTWATLDNTDINPNTYQGFDRYVVVDARVRYQWHKQWSAALGLENLNNQKYYLFHPFPQRTFIAELRFAL
jgi:iron complex outermembrane receptor protein